MTPLDRKLKTEALLRAHKVPINPNLPIIESEDEVTIAKPQQVAGRICVISGLAAKAYGCPHVTVLRWFEQIKLFPFASPHEIELVRSETLNNTAIENLRIQTEALWEFAWTLSLIDKADHFRVCGDQLVHLVPKPSEQIYEFVRNAQLRSTEEVLSEADFLFRLHWAVRDASLKRLPLPNRLPYYVTHERLRAVNWLISPGQNWEDVDTST
jgi:hypothetical protein